MTSIFFSVSIFVSIARGCRRGRSYEFTPACIIDFGLGFAPLSSEPIGRHLSIHWYNITDPMQVKSLILSLCSEKTITHHKENTPQVVSSSSPASSSLTNFLDKSTAFFLLSYFFTSTSFCGTVTKKKKLQKKFTPLCYRFYNIRELLRFRLIINYIGEKIYCNFTTQFFLSS